ncbi:MAG: hypothetical protein N3C12_07390 [Candidatus Binatia bacterium]|nr:hypothetical protein [Candidatus Binatia bacterium]
MKKRVTQFSTILMTFVFLAQSGCSFMGPGTQTITIQASDPSAQISIDGCPVGRGTVSVNLSTKKSHNVIAQAGDRTGSATIKQLASTYGMLDLVGGFVVLVPWLGVLAPGFGSSNRISST